MYTHFREGVVDPSKHSLDYGLKYDRKRVIDPYPQ